MKAEKEDIVKENNALSVALKASRKDVENNLRNLKRRNMFLKMKLRNLMFN